MHLLGSLRDRFFSQILHRQEQGRKEFASVNKNCASVLRLRIFAAILQQSKEIERLNLGMCQPRPSFALCAAARILLGEHVAELVLFALDDTQLLFD